MAMRISRRLDFYRIYRLDFVIKSTKHCVRHFAVDTGNQASREVDRHVNRPGKLEGLPSEILRDMKKLKETTEITRTSIFKGTVSQKIAVFDLYLFEKALQTDKSKKGFINVIHHFRAKDKQSRGHMSFIYAAMQYIDKFGLAKDLDMYNELLDVFPKFKFINRTILDAVWPRPHPQIDCALDLLTMMEDNYVRPDNLTYTILLEVFGRASFPVQKAQRIAFWFDKYADINPYLLHEEDLKDNFKVCKSALQRITNDAESIKVFYCEQSENDDHQKSFLIGSQNKEQKEFIANYRKSMSLYVEGPFNIWMNNVKESYFILRSGCLDIANPETHEDETRIREGMILGICMTNMYARDALKSWLQYLQTDNPKINEFNIIFNVNIPDEIVLDSRY